MSSAGKCSFGSVRLSRRCLCSHMLCRSRQILSVLPGAFEVTLDFLSWEHFHRDSASEREKRVNEKLFLMCGVRSILRQWYMPAEVTCSQLILPPFPGTVEVQLCWHLPLASWKKNHDYWGIAAHVFRPVNKKKKKLCRKHGFLCTSSWLWDCVGLHLF